MINLRGVGVALVTPFNESGDVDFTSLERLLNHVMEGGVNYLVVFGTTAEPPTMSCEEREEILRFIKSKNSKNLPIVLGMGANNTSGLVDDIKKADFDGISAILSVTPFYNKPNQAGMYAHYMAVAEASPVPVILYNVPSRTGVNLTAQTVLKLANDSKNIIAVKEASGNLAQVSHIIKNAPEEFFVISGDDNLTLPIMAIGGDGVISVAANVFTYDFTQMVEAITEENMVIARSKYLKLLEATELLFTEGNPAGVKCALSLKGIISTKNVRLPLAAASKELEEKLAKQIEEYKL